MVSVLEEKEAIRELLARYCHHFDAGRFEDWLDLFTEDGTFDLQERGRFTGREALQTFARSIPVVDGIPAFRHFVTNVLIRVAGTTATARCDVLVVQGPVPTVMLAGRYDDRLVKREDRWLFAERRVHIDLTA